MSALSQDYRPFKRAVIYSLTGHILLLILIILSPYLPKTSKKGMIHYVNVISFPGGGGGGGKSPAGGGKAGQKLAATEVPVRESLRDLTTPQKLQQESPSTLRHPVDKPESGKKPPPKKKTLSRNPPRQPQTRPRPPATVPRGPVPGRNPDFRWALAKARAAG